MEDQTGDQSSDAHESRPQMSVQMKLNVNGCFVESEALRLVDGDSPGQLQRQLEAGAWDIRCGPGAT